MEKNESKIRPERLNKFVGTDEGITITWPEKSKEKIEKAKKSDKK